MNDLSTALHRWAGQETAGEPPVAELIAEGKRRRNRRRAAAVSTAALAVAAAAGVTLGVSERTAPPGPAAAHGSSRTASTAVGASPQMELAAAVSSTTGSSYRFTINNTLNLPAWKIDNVTATCTGALDPVKRNAYLNSSQVFRAMLVDGEHYVAKGPNWVDLGQGSVSDFLMCGDENVPGAVAADPAAELKILQKSGTVTKTPGGYAFTNPGVEGTVKVSDGKISELDYTVNQKPTSDYPAYNRHIVMELSGYGEKVSVKKPL